MGAICSLAAPCTPLLLSLEGQPQKEKADQTWNSRSQKVKAGARARPRARVKWGMEPAQAGAEWREQETEMQVAARGTQGDPRGRC